MARRIKTIFQVRRALSGEWERVNPILRAGEPGFALDTYVLKIGDGTTQWNDLAVCDTSGGSGNYIAPKKEDFPLVGDESVIYRAKDEQTLYQWNEATRSYEELCVSSVSITDIELVNGGDASG